MRRPVAALVVALVFASACSRCAPSTGGGGDGGGGGDAGDSGTAVRDGGRSAPSTALDDLLHFTDARLAVSSKVDNPRDHAEHIADGRLDTAWNGKSGDLVGAWFGFEVPRTTRVRLIELTVGFAARSKKGEDLFTMNHRIARVRLTRDSVALSEHALDVERRELQPIRVDAAGGQFRIEVLEVKPGSREDWREVVVSELRVLGIAGPARHDAPTVPRVGVGGFDGPPPSKLAAADAGAKLGPVVDVSAEALCKDWLANRTAEYKAGLANGFQGVPWEPPPPSCHVETRLSEHGVNLLLFDRSDLAGTFTDLGVSYGGHAYTIDRVVQHDSHFDPHCLWSSGGSLSDARIEPGTPPVAVFVTYAWETSSLPPTPLDDGGLEPNDGKSHRTLDETRCDLLPSGPSCATRRTAEKLGTDRDTVDPMEPLPW